MKQQQLTLASFGQLPIGTVTAMLTLTVLVICGCLQVEGNKANDTTGQTIIRNYRNGF